ncbi:ATP-binding protein [Chryseolinea sp. T2]|uniref:sensor histidine kinase n=1 Tax=Chryseolinea sp. T2 TaxID=3129255 RepID=UPI0030776379
MRGLREYFIGANLRSEPDVLRRASIVLVYNIMLVSMSTMVVFFFVYIFEGHYRQLIKTFIVMSLFASALFYFKARGSIAIVCNILLLISWSNNIINIYLFGEFNFFIALLSCANILFAFHTLGNRPGLIYAAAHFIPILVHEMGKYFGWNIYNPTPRQLPFTEELTALVLVFFVIVYLIYHYHQAYELAKAGLHQTVKDLRVAKDMAEEMNRLKTNFLSNMSHEIRTPINGILGLSQVIDMETDSTDIKSYVKLQQQSGQRLLNTITSILDLSRLEAKHSQLSLKQIDVSKLTLECIHSLGLLARQKELTFTYHPADEPLLCLADETMLYQVINNIVGNAIKFTEKGSVEVSTSSLSNVSAVISVRDTGIGISDEFLPRIFNSFEQESSGRSRSHEGSGLGLSISKKYIELLGGEITIQSEKDKGSTFEIVLPLHQP